MSTLPAADGWKRVERPPSLFRRFEFGSYAGTRAFLDKLAGLSEETGLYPDLGFGTTYANVTIYLSNGERATVGEIDFARRAATLAAGGGS